MQPQTQTQMRLNILPSGEAVTNFSTMISMAQGTQHVNDELLIKMAFNAGLVMDKGIGEVNVAVERVMSYLHNQQVPEQISRNIINHWKTLAGVLHSQIVQTGLREISKSPLTFKELTINADIAFLTEE